MNENTGYGKGFDSRLSGLSFSGFRVLGVLGFGALGVWGFRVSGWLYDARDLSIRICGICRRFAAKMYVTPKLAL
jgi:hypothetical protein